MKMGDKGPTVRLGIIGLGGRGLGQTETLIQMPDVEVVAVCDVYEDRVEKGKDLIYKHRGVYPAGETDFKKVIAREAGRIEMSLNEAEKLGGEVICFLHYPPVMNGIKCEEIMDVLVKHGVKRCFFGHLHGNFSSFINNAVVEGIKFSLISADFLEFCPKLVEKI